jgi:hypothetical protein
MKKDMKVVPVSKSWMFLTSGKHLCYEIIEKLISFFIFYTPCALILYSFCGINSVNKGLCISIFVILMIIVSRKAKYLSTAIIFDLIMLVIVYLISANMLEKLTLCLLIFIHAIIFIKQRFNNLIEFYSISNFIFSEAVLTICYCIAFGYKQSNMEAYITIESIIIAICYIIYFHLTRTEKLLDWESNFGSSFKNQIKKLKIAISSLIFGIIVVFNLLFWKLGIFSLMDWIQQKIYSFFGSDNPDVNQVKDSLPKNETKNIDTNNLIGSMNRKSSNSYLLEAIIKLIELVFLVVFIIVVIYLLWVLYLKLKEIFKTFYDHRTTDNEKRESLLTTEELKNDIISKVKSLKVELSNFVKRSNRKQIRAIYYKIIMKYRKRGLDLLDSDTPLELLEKIQKDIKENIEEATSIYEKARYRIIDCDDEDVRKIKKYL